VRGLFVARSLLSVNRNHHGFKQLRYCCLEHEEDLWRKLSGSEEPSANELAGNYRQKEIATLAIVFLAVESSLLYVLGEREMVDFMDNFKGRT
jgi:hypothetical protein